MTEEQLVHEHIARLESKVDRLTDAITTLVRVEERQATHGQRIGALEEGITVVKANVSTIDKKLDQWINRGVGMWSILVMAWTVYLAWRG